MNYHFDVERLRNEIRSLVRDFPELEEDHNLKADTIEAETSIDHVMDKLIRALRESATMEAAIVDEVVRLNQRGARYEMRIQYLRALMLRLLEEAGIKKLERPLGTLSVAIGKPKVIITDESQLPPGVVRIKREPDKQLIAASIARNTKVPGAELSNAEPHLTIRT